MGLSNCTADPSLSKTFESIQGCRWPRCIYAILMLFLAQALRRTTSGTPIQPHEKPGERPPAKEAPNTEFDILGDQFVSEPLGLELPSQANLPKTTVCEDWQIPNDPSMERDFHPFSLDGETSSPTTESRGLESSGIEELGQANVSLTAVS
jgi:hypothetical protein